MLMMLMMVMLLLMLMLLLSVGAVGMLRRVITIAIRPERRSGRQDSPATVAGAAICGPVGCDRINAAAALMVHHLRITTVETVSVQRHVAVGGAIIVAAATAVAGVDAVVAVDGGAVAVAIRAVRYCEGERKGNELEPTPNSFKIFLFLYKSLTHPTMSYVPI